jgi:hypothetical protein
MLHLDPKPCWAPLDGPRSHQGPHRISILAIRCAATRRPIPFVTSELRSSLACAGRTGRGRVADTSTAGAKTQRSFATEGGLSG